MCFTAPAGAPAEPGRRHECGRVQGWSPSRKIPARAPPAEASRFQWPLGNVVRGENRGDEVGGKRTLCFPHPLP
ncbi:hypothetical protein NDU88_005639 [Pleurodeles waltl]|uniref:Uncharacterized protein n=1 Tax=Pleurodeles waltl TaxID=8319 RepID=A0AAV7PFY8_PLEWA|nr:hypothetical protein NDU88_005639 [Pleurodeles waltl]